MNKILRFSVLVVICMITMMPDLALAQGEQASDISVAYAKKVANTCLGKWESQSCLGVISESNLVMAANYVEVLEEKGRTNDADKIVEDCAAATAATKGAYPAYAMNSAFAQCANTMATTADQTSILPDASQFQLLYAAIQCLSKEGMCPIIEMGLSLYK